ncbi:MAG: TatD family hydrolase [Bacteroidota bacterium]
MITGIIDTHAHLYADEFSSDSEEMIGRAKAAGVEKIILPNIDLNSTESMLQLIEKYPEICFPAMGLHPTSVSSNYKKDLQIIYEYFDKRKFIAVGESGIDLYWDKTFEAEQEDAFRIQLQWAKEKNLPIIIHTRKSFEQVIRCVKDFKGNVSGIFHCFSGSYEEAQRIISIGNFKMGIGGVLTYKNSGLPEVIEKIDLQHLVLETDAPYLPPVPYRGKRNETSYILKVAEKLAEIKNCS